MGCIRFIIIFPIILALIVCTAILFGGVGLLILGLAILITLGIIYGK